LPAAVNFAEVFADAFLLAIQFPFCGVTANIEPEKGQGLEKFRGAGPLDSCWWAPGIKGRDYVCRGTRVDRRSCNVNFGMARSKLIHMTQVATLLDGSCGKGKYCPGGDK
jgi:hypothetical protein